MNSAVPGRLSRCNNARRKPIGRVSSKYTDHKKTEPIGSNQEWPPCSGPSRVQPSPEASSVEQVQHSSQHKVRNLNPAPLTKRELAQQMEPRVEIRDSVVLNEHEQEKEWTGDGSAEQQYSGK